MRVVRRKVMKNDKQKKVMRGEGAERRQRGMENVFCHPFKKEKERRKERGR